MIKKEIERQKQILEAREEAVKQAGVQLEAKSEGVTNAIGVEAKAQASQE